MLNALILSWLQCFSDAVHPESFTHAVAPQTEVHRCYAKLQLKVNETKSAVASSLASMRVYPISLHTTHNG